MQMHFPDAVIPIALIHNMMPDIISYAKAIIQTRPSGFLYERPDFRLFSLYLDIIIQNPILYVDDLNIQNLSLEVDDYGNMITDLIIEESMEDPNNIKMVPASKNAIESLEKVKLENNNHLAERCSICLTEFDYGDDAEQVSSMPCKHVYHQECLIQWLKTSHLCPLCRYPMPTN
ncbi:E3 ubiquitin-protein ligase RING1-like [Arachis ipaensis]|uniref:E3 ubiquitin-protein ligase RING1-like n=1 Tax=Arachis ipaensis TaxID=130454 RepID=UPI0007AF602E|nr:E3 ubiquitin-protein ligase RING1-like [Arachis ipaensis]XP_025685472.1 E3 ubiquitin-protein ligase RING1-like [Arachis hypogaea]